MQTILISFKVTWRWDMGKWQHTEFYIVDPQDGFPRLDSCSPGGNSDNT